MSVDDTVAERLLAILREQPVAALATIHRGEPAVSMVPYAVLPSAGALVIHVSRLATHTADMIEHPRVSLMATAIPDPAVAPQALPRAMFQARAERLADSDARCLPAREAYLARFPDSEPMFGFGDFSLFAITPKNARVVAGFAQASTILSQDLAAVLARWRPAAAGGPRPG